MEEGHSGKGCTVHAQARATQRRGKGRSSVGLVSDPWWAAPGLALGPWGRGWDESLSLPHGRVAGGHVENRQFDFASLLPHLTTEVQITLIPKSSYPGVSELAIAPARNQPRGFPGGAVVESLPANAGDTGSSPGLGGSHMPRSNWACEPQLLSLRVWSLCSATREAAMVRGPRTAMKSGPHLPQLEKALAQKQIGRAHV